MSTVRKAVAQFLTGLVTWATAVTMSDAAQITSSEWVVLLGGLVGAFLVWLVPNDGTVSANDRLRELGLYDDEPSERGATEAGGVITALLIVILVVVLLKLLGAL